MKYRREAVLVILVTFLALAFSACDDTTTAPHTAESDLFGGPMYPDTIMTRGQ